MSFSRLVQLIHMMVTAFLENEKKCAKPLDLDLELEKHQNRPDPRGEKINFIFFFSIEG